MFVGFDLTFFPRHMAGPLSATTGANPPLAVERIPESEAPPGLTFEFDIAMGVRRADRALADELNAVIDRRAKDIAAVLDRHHVPRR